VDPVFLRERTETMITVKSEEEFQTLATAICEASLTKNDILWLRDVINDVLPRGYQVGSLIRQVYDLDRING
jgi:hypothetical protein